MNHSYKGFQGHLPIISLQKKKDKTSEDENNTIYIVYLINTLKLFKRMSKVQNLNLVLNVPVTVFQKNRKF